MAFTNQKLFDNERRSSVSTALKFSMLRARKNILIQITLKEKNLYILESYNLKMIVLLHIISLLGQILFMKLLHMCMWI